MYTWEDSAVVYCWILNIDKLYKIFCSQSKEKLESVDIKSWKLANSDTNPSDMISRGLFSSEFVDNELWFHGPAFVRLNQKNWPTLQAGITLRRLF